MFRTTFLFAFLFSFCNLSAQSFVSTVETITTNTSSTVNSENDAAAIPLKDVSKFIGRNVTVCGRVYSAKLLKNIVGKPTLMNLGGDNANERIEVRIHFSDLVKLEDRPEKLFVDKELCITGTISNDHGFNEITLNAINQQKLIELAKQTLPTEHKNTYAKNPLVSNAYLFAAPDLNEPIITHLKQGSIVVPQYFTGKWAYVKVIERLGVLQQPEGLYGFILSHSLPLQKNKSSLFNW